MLIRRACPSMWRSVFRTHVPSERGELCRILIWHFVIRRSAVGRTRSAPLESVCSDGPSEISIFLFGGVTLRMQLQTLEEPLLNGRPSSLQKPFFLSLFLMLLFPKPIFFFGVFLPALICVHVQAKLRAQVEVEKRVDAEDEEQNCHDDQEGVLKKTEHVTLYQSPVLLLTRRSDSALFGIITGFLLPKMCGVSRHLRGPWGVSV